MSLRLWRQAESKNCGKRTGLRCERQLYPRARSPRAGGLKARHLFCKQKTAAFKSRPVHYGAVDVLCACGCDSNDKRRNMHSSMTEPELPDNWESSRDYKEAVGELETDRLIDIYRRLTRDLSRAIAEGQPPHVIGDMADRQAAVRDILDYRGESERAEAVHRAAMNEGDEDE